MRLAIAYNTKNRLELTKQSFPVLQTTEHALLWSDGSTEEDALDFFHENRHWATESYAKVHGGADSAIVHSLTRLLRHPARYTHVGLVESDVMLDEDWLKPTLDLFEKGERDGLDVGAVSPRSYVDRVLIQRSGYAVAHNIGAGVIIFTREAAEIVLRTFRTTWWPDNVRLFAQISGIDLRTYAAFHGNEQFITTDWGWEAQLARHGMASLALTPSKAQMIGQVPALYEQGLTLTTGALELMRNEKAFALYQSGLRLLRTKSSYELPGLIARQGTDYLFFPHQIPAIETCEMQNNFELQWSQGFGPFAYRAKAGGSEILPVLAGPVSILASGGTNGAKVTIEDTRSGFKTSPDLPPSPEPVSIQVPGGPIPRLITCQFGEGAVFYGLQTADPQMIDTTWKFDWSQLPEPT